MIVFRPVRASWKAWTLSWPSKAAESNRVMGEESGAAAKARGVAPTPRPCKLSRAGSTVRHGWRGPWPGLASRDRRCARGKRCGGIAHEGQHVVQHDLTVQVAQQQVVAARVIGAAIAGLQPPGGPEGGVLGDDVVVGAVLVEGRRPRFRPPRPGRAASAPPDHRWYPRGWRRSCCGPGPCAGVLQRCPKRGCAAPATPAP